MSRHEDTIAALATPTGTAALALLRISGPDTGAVLAAVFGSAPPPRRVRHADYRNARGELLDDTLVTFFAGPHSYTGEDAAEISCHGNPFIAQKILEDLFARGCRPAEPGEFTQRAFLQGRLDLSQAEAVMDLIHARSERALSAAQQQLRGALGRRMSGLVDRLLGALARVEAYIDFPDEDLPVEDRSWLRAELEALTADTARLLATQHYGEVLRRGIRTVIVGHPNVGKSSVLNRLVGRDRALVSPEPGTTRDFIEETIQLGGHCLRLIDTAGLNPSPAPLERRGIEKTFEQAEEADLYLVVLDASEPGTWQVSPIIAERLRLDNTLVINNKCDLPEALGARWGEEKGLRSVALSALTGDGWEQLQGAIQTLADGFQREVGEEQIAVSARHARALEEASAGLRAALDKVKAGDPVELLASDLRSVLAAYGEITGRVDNERMLDQLFAAFCIGK